MREHRALASSYPVMGGSAGVVPVDSEAGSAAAAADTPRERDLLEALELTAGPAQTPIASVLQRLRALEEEFRSAVRRRRAAAQLELQAREDLLRVQAEAEVRATALAVADADVRVRERRLQETIDALGGGGAPLASAFQPHDELVGPLRAAATPAAAIQRYPRWTWFGLYVLAIVVPLVVARVTGPPRRSFPAELGSGFGIVGLSLLALQLVLPARLSLLAPLGADVAVRLHRRLADVTIALVVAHVAVVIMAQPRRIHLLTVVGAPWRAQAAVAAVVFLGALYATAFLRRRVGASYAGWRGLHIALAAGALLLAVAHTVGVGRYLGGSAAAPELAGLTLAALGPSSSSVSRDQGCSRRSHT